MNIFFGSLFVLSFLWGGGGTIPQPELAKTKQVSLQLQTMHHGFVAGYQPFALSRDGRLLATAGGDGVRLHDVATGRLTRILPHSGYARSLAFSPDGKRVVVSSFNTTIYSTITGNRLVDLQVDVHKVPVQPHGVAFSTDGKQVIQSGYASDVVVFDSHTGKTLRQVKTGLVASMQAVPAVTPNGGLVMVARDHTTGNPRIHTIDMKNGKVHQKLPDLAVPAINREGTFLAAINKMGQLEMRVIICFRVVSRKPMYSIQVKDGVYKYALGPNGLIATRNRTGHVQLWKWDKEIAVPQGVVSNAGEHMMFTGDGKHLVYRNTSGVVHWYNIGSGKIERTIGNKSIAIVQQATLSEDGKHLAAIVGRQVYLHNLANGRSVPLKTSDIVDIQRVHLPTFSPDGKRLALFTEAAYGQTYLSFWNVADGKQEGASLKVGMFGIKSGRTDMHFSRDGKMLAIGVPSLPPLDESKRNSVLEPATVEISVYSMANKKPVIVMKKQSLPGSFLAMRFTHKGKKLLVGTDAKITEWNTTNGKQVRSLVSPKGGWELPVAFSPDGSVLLAYRKGPILRGGQTWDLKAYDAKNGKELYSLKERRVLHPRFLGFSGPYPRDRVRFTSGGKLILSGSHLSVWDWKKGNRLVHKKLEKGAKWLAVTGQTLAAVNIDGTVTFRRLGDTQPHTLATLGYSHESKGHWMVISADGVHYDHDGWVPAPELYAVVDGRPSDVRITPEVQREVGLLPKALQIIN